MKSGYESITWVRDHDGSEFACYLDDIENLNQLTDEEKAKCLNVNEIVGTERW